MKRYVILFSFFLFSFQIFAQKATISGVILDESNQPLAGASISVKNSYLGAYTNFDGKFVLDQMTKGSYVLVISYIGYTTIEKAIVVNADVSITVTLNPNAFGIQPAVRTAIKARETTPVAKTDLSKSDVEKQNVVQDIPYQLEQTPSVVATSENGTGMGYTNMRIRGTDMSRINVTVNGIPLNDAESQGVFWVNMADFASSVDEVQIQRGVGTSTNGASSFGASVNFETTAIEEKPYARVSSTVGSFNTFKENIALGSGILDSCVSFSVRYSKLNSDGWVQRGFSDHQSFQGIGTYFKGKNTVTAQVLLGQEKTGITWWGLPSEMLNVDRTYNPSGKYYDDYGNEKFNLNETDNYWQNHYFLNFNHEFSKNLKFSAALHTTTGKGFYEEYKSRFDDWGSENTFAQYGMSNIKLTDTILVIDGFTHTFPDSVITSSDMIRQKWIDNIFYGYTASLNYSKNKTEASVGTAYNIYEGNHFGKIKWVKFMPNMSQDYEWYRNKSRKTDFNIFAKIQYKITPKVSFYGDVQYRAIEYTMKGIDDDLYTLNQKYNWEFLNPKAGVFYKINKRNSIFASFAIANREPTRSDLKDGFKDSLATKNPLHETLYDYEIGYQYTLQKIGVGINLYNMQYNNQLVLTGKLNDVGSAVMTNVKDSYRRGIEVTLGIRPSKEIEWNGNVTLSQNKIKNYVEYSTDNDADWNETVKVTNMGTTNISYSPNAVASSSLLFYPDKTMSFGITSKYVGKQYFDNTNDEVRKIDSYLVHNFQFQYIIPFEKTRKLSVQFLINNILDAKYISNAYGGNWYEQGKENSWMYYFPQAGINYMVKATFDF